MLVTSLAVAVRGSVTGLRDNSSQVMCHVPGFGAVLARVGAVRFVHIIIKKTTVVLRRMVRARGRASGGMSAHMAREEATVDNGDGEEHEDRDDDLPSTFEGHHGRSSTKQTCERDQLNELSSDLGLW